MVAIQLDSTTSRSADTSLPSVGAGDIASRDETGPRRWFDGPSVSTASSDGATHERIVGGTAAVVAGDGSTVPHGLLVTRVRRSARTPRTERRHRHDRSLNGASRVDPRRTGHGSARTVESATHGT